MTISAKVRGVATLRRHEQHDEDRSRPGDGATDNVPSIAIDAAVPASASVLAESDDDIRTEYAARWVAAALREAVEDRGHAVLALVGGSSVAAVHTALLGVEIDWANVTITLGDERAVPAASPERNWRVIEPLVDPLVADGRLPVANVVGLPDLPADADAEQLDEALSSMRDAVDHIDVALLGLGPDGHVASLFPHHPGLTAIGTFAVVTDSPKPPPLRMSATVAMLAGAAAIALVGFGDDKAEAVAAVATAGSLSDRPGRVVHLARRGIIITDRLPQA